MPSPENTTGLQRKAKRTLDAAVAIILLACCTPILVIIAILIKLDSPGPVLVRQQRVSRNRRPFTLYKLRSMVANAEELQAAMLDLNESDGPLFKIKDDPRCTRVGKFMRRLSLDELPQLWNVLTGEMSLVGPRPPFIHEVQADFLRQSRRLQVPPGMTGLWQVSGRSLLRYDDMIGLDIRYTRTWSLWLDLRILARTVPVVATGWGAY
jgi:lipopolysaccharide/colanic/teichoic acid biosynthesis glycosyltransferase